MKIKKAGLLLIAIVVFLVGITNEIKSPAQNQTSFKSILSKVPEKERIVLLESMVFVKGKLASTMIKDIKRLLNKSDFQALKVSVGWGNLGADHEGYRCSGPGECKKAEDHMCNPEFCKGPTPGISLGEMLRTVPQLNQKQFLDSLEFLDGRLVSGNTKVIKKYVTKDEFVQLPTVLPLKMGECWRLGGDIVVDDTCPETTTNSPFGGSIKGKFRCKVRGAIGEGLCIDENTTSP